MTVVPVSSEEKEGKRRGGGLSYAMDRRMTAPKSEQKLYPAMCVFVRKGGFCNRIFYCGQKGCFMGLHCGIHTEKMACTSASRLLRSVRAGCPCNNSRTEAFSGMPPYGGAETCERKSLFASISADPSQQEGGRDLCL